MYAVFLFFVLCGAVFMFVCVGLFYVYMVLRFLRFPFFAFFVGFLCFGDFVFLVF